jgi:crossover junction endodeoxyribonuclease RuvC
VRSVVGVDPGVTGALAVVTDGRLITVIDMPVNEGRADGSEIREILEGVVMSAETFVFVEDTQPMPKNGSIASFKLGLNTGIVLGVVQSLSLPLRRVRPADWKRGQGLLGKTKDASRGLATELYPGFANQFRMVKNDGRAEAALIARHGLSVLIKEGIT